MIVVARIWKMADVCTSSNLYSVDLYKGTWEIQHLNLNLKFGISRWTEPSFESWCCSHDKAHTANIILKNPVPYLSRQWCPLHCLWLLWRDNTSNKSTNCRPEIPCKLLYTRYIRYSHSRLLFKDRLSVKCAMLAPWGFWARFNSRLDQVQQQI